MTQSAMTKKRQEELMDGRMDGQIDKDMQTDTNSCCQTWTVTGRQTITYLRIVLMMPMEGSSMAGLPGLLTDCIEASDGKPTLVTVSITTPQTTSPQTKLSSVSVMTLHLTISSNQAIFCERDDTTSYHLLKPSYLL